MKTLLVGFDSAWTSKNLGAIVGLFHDDQGYQGYQLLGNPQSINYQDASLLIQNWQAAFKPDQTIIMLDQPTIVPNPTGSRPVENLVSSPVSRRYGGVQPANTSKSTMFGNQAPVWHFLNQFGGPANPLNPAGDTQVIETYPVLGLISMGWTLPDGNRQTGRLPKYNPQRHTFNLGDWQFVCNSALAYFQGYGLTPLVNWINANAQAILTLNSAGKKHLQDQLDALLCLIMAMKYHEHTPCMMLGDYQTGYMVVPHDPVLELELVTRCQATNRIPANWIHYL
jgi:predicted RNase H-like nuclease